MGAVILGDGRGHETGWVEPSVTMGAVIMGDGRGHEPRGRGHLPWWLQGCRGMATVLRVVGAAMKADSHTHEG